MSQISVGVVIPNRMSETPEMTLRSLARQTFGDWISIVVYDQNKGAPWARNRGFDLVRGRCRYVLFSDNDIEWNGKALKVMVETLDSRTRYAYAYPSFIQDGVSFGKAWDADALRKSNYITTCSLIRADMVLPFDESLGVYQDWDLWLRMLEKGWRGIWCGPDVLFKTNTKPGDITWLQRERMKDAG